jgi:hypothetical protein
MTHIEAMFNVLPFSVGGRDPNQGHIRVQDLIQSGNPSVELRYDEEVLVLEGKNVGDLDNFQDKDFEKVLESNKLENSEKSPKSN